MMWFWNPYVPGGWDYLTSREDDIKDAWKDSKVHILVPRHASHEWQEAQRNMAYKVKDVRFDR